MKARVLSAHRLRCHRKIARKAADRGFPSHIAGAGGAAHLAGVIAAHTWLPVLVFRSIEAPGTRLSVIHAQMPGGISVGRWRS